VFGDLWSKSHLGHSMQDFFDQGGRKAIVGRAYRAAPSDVATLTWGRGRERLLEASSAGAWGRRLSARIDLLRGGGRFALTMRDDVTAFEAIFSGVSLAPRSPHRLDRVLFESYAGRHLAFALPRASLAHVLFGSNSSTRLPEGSSNKI
jgi:hypothetical protein